MSIKLRGYITSRKFFGERVPQNVQNLVIRDFCNKNNYKYLLSATEYYMKNNYSILKKVIIDDLKKNIDGVVAYSIFQLPEDREIRNNIVNSILSKKKILCFALEDLSFRDKSDFEKIKIIWQIKIKSKKNEKLIKQLTEYI